MEVGAKMQIFSQFCSLSSMEIVQILSLLLVLNKIIISNANSNIFFFHFSKERNRRKERIKEGIGTKGSSRTTATTTEEMLNLCWFAFMKLSDARFVC